MKADLQVQQDVIAELRWEPSVNANDIGVLVKDGIVTLTGHVSSFGEKWHAERAAQRVAGVRALTLEIDVILPGTSQRTDVDIAQAIKHALNWSIHIPRNSVQVMVERGHVTLLGAVHWDYQRQAAVHLIRYLMGVTGVSNQINLKPEVSTRLVKSDIEAALQRRAHDEAQRIDVTVHEGDVTLSGQVPNLHEKDLVRHSVWATPGVRNVIDNLQVAS